MSRKEKEYNFIYKTTSTLDGKYYVGIHSTNNLNDGYIGSGKKLWYYIKRYGKESFKFEILEFLPDRKSLRIREKEIVTESLLRDKLCLNLSIGGGGGFISEEQQRKRSMAASSVLQSKLKEDPDFRNYWLSRMREGVRNGPKRVISESERENLIKRNKEKIWTDEMRKKVGLKNSKRFHGEGNSQYGTRWITKNGENKKVKEEDLNSFLVDGWVAGRYFKSNNSLTPYKSMT